LILAMVLSENMLAPCEAFEVNPPEVISHTLLARLILEPPGRVATRQKKSGMAFLADSADSSEVQKSRPRDQQEEAASIREKNTKIEVAVKSETVLPSSS